MRKHRSFNVGLANASNRPEGDLQDRACERAGSARKQSLAEGVGCASDGRPPDMVKLDLRTPLPAAISSRLSCRQAATCFAVSTAYNFDIVSKATGAIRLPQTPAGHTSPNIFAQREKRPGATA
jgi:hypothetical protein